MTELTDVEQKEHESLQERAKQMGITFHPNTGLEKLRNKVNAKLLGEVETPEVDKPKEVAPINTSKAATKENPGQVPVETKNQRHSRLRKNAAKLVRIRITCMNPNKKDWEGEVFTVSNSVVGTHKKFVPFNNTEGWHVPQIIYNMIKERQFQTFYTEKARNGVKVRKSKLINEFAIEVLDKLTPDELTDLARRQAVANTID